MLVFIRKAGKKYYEQNLENFFCAFYWAFETIGKKKSDICIASVRFISFTLEEKKNEKLRMK